MVIIGEDMSGCHITVCDSTSSDLGGGGGGESRI